MSYAIDQTMRAAEDSESTIDTLREELAAAERALAAYRERDAFLMRERIAVATALDVPYATELGEAVALRLTRLTTERDTARQAHAELAAAVREYTASAAEFMLADVAYRGDESADAARASALYARGWGAMERLDAAQKRVVALLAAAPPRSTVDARLVREYLAARVQYDSDEALDATDTALRAALAGCV